MPKIFAALDDLFFLVKIQDGAKHAGLDLTQLSSAESIRTRANENPDCYLFDLNCAATKPIETIQWLRSQYPKMRILGFHSHVQEELKRKALEAGCDQVFARSAMSSRMTDILSSFGKIATASEID